MAQLGRSASADAPRGRLVAWAAFAGLAAAAAVYVRPSWLLFAPAFAIVFVVATGRRRGWARSIGMAAILVGATYAALVPWAYRNQRVTGHWVFTTLWVGPSLYDGFNQGATGDSDMSFFERDRLMDSMSEYHVDRTYRQRAWEYARTHPSRAASLTLAKIARYWKPWPSADLFAGVWPKLAVSLYFVPLVIAALAGWPIAWRTGWGWTLTWGPILYFAAIHAVFLGSLRYRLPAEYPLCVAAAVGLQRLWTRPAASISPSPPPGPG
jgi:hypothetical protein